VAANLEGRRLASFTRIGTAVRAAVEEALHRILTPRRSIDVLREVRALDGGPARHGGARCRGSRAGRCALWRARPAPRGARLLTDGKGLVGALVAGTCAVAGAVFGRLVM